jgi:hypothetical protein
MSGEVYLNGRRPADWELPALERARQHERERDMRVLAGVLTAEPVPLYAGRTADTLPAVP